LLRPRWWSFNLKEKPLAPQREHPALVTDPIESGSESLPTDFSAHLSIYSLFRSFDQVCEGSHTSTWPTSPCSWTEELSAGSSDEAEDHTDPPHSLSGLRLLDRLLSLDLSFTAVSMRTLQNGIAAPDLRQTAEP
jgi:hypothetical protein